MKLNIPVNEPYFNGNEKKYLLECIDTGWISSEGPFVSKFEKEFSKKVKRKYGIAVSNGTAALEIAIKALDIGEGDEVIIPTFTIISCAGAIVKTGATPVLVDSDIKTWNMNVNEIEKNINNRTKAIMVVHTYGLPVEMDLVLDLARKYNLYIIEDAAEMHGQTYKEIPCGSFGDISTFSFYPNKHITTGEGGMILTNNEVLAEKCKSLRNLCFKDGQRFVHDEIGWNYRFTNMQAAIGLAQLENIDEHISRKRKIGKLYVELLSDIDVVKLPPASTEYAENIYWIFGLILNNNITLNANDIMIKLKRRGIGSRPFFYPMHMQPVFIKMGLFKNQTFPIAENMALRGFYIPSGVGCKERQILQVTDVLKSILIK